MREKGRRAAGSHRGRRHPAPLGMLTRGSRRDGDVGSASRFWTPPPVHMVLRSVSGQPHTTCPIEDEETHEVDVIVVTVSAVTVCVAVPVTMTGGGVTVTPYVTVVGSVTVMVSTTVAVART